ncbi:hypothetical protein ACFX11_009661 [Malus domestica]
MCPSRLPYPPPLHPLHLRTLRHQASRRRPITFQKVPIPKYPNSQIAHQSKLPSSLILLVVRNVEAKTAEVVKVTICPPENGQSVPPRHQSHARSCHRPHP